MSASGERIIKIPGSVHSGRVCFGAQPDDSGEDPLYANLTVSPPFSPSSDFLKSHAIGEVTVAHYCTTGGVTALVLESNPDSERSPEDRRGQLLRTAEGIIDELNAIQEDGGRRWLLGI